MADSSALRDGGRAAMRSISSAVCSPWRICAGRRRSDLSSLSPTVRVNRAGRSLSDERRSGLDQARAERCKLFGRGSSG
jgi:Protein of unknown function (DUF3175)